ncbi:hypothetical protein GT755_38130 [Herbidospora sp. NEAU-GS84]|uniref:Uncharacterized protein n=1 Tax=Herbidospora solisilvae TaxID=2696284 RepID=A0A7C9NCQ5_9ACTN|nr:hypothetical protein [Herbidospora solisilvae]NAS27473.1 hypothetical protein [Herbidospora solisilvae]
MITINRRAPVAIAWAAIRSALGALVRFTAVAVVLTTPAATPEAATPPNGSTLALHASSITQPN